MPEIQKYKETEIIISSAADKQTPADVATLLGELDDFEQEVNLLVSDLSEVDKSISAFRDSCNAVAESIDKLGTSFLGLFMEGDSSKARGVVGLAALAVKGFGYVSGRRKQQAAFQEYNEQQAAILQQKVAVAETKLPYVSESYKKFKSGIEWKMEKLYDKEFTATTSYDDDMLDKHVLIFKKNLCMIMKARFLSDTMLYCIKEMEAWKIGKHNSIQTPPSILQELSQELSSWPGRLGFQDESFDEMVTKAMYCSSGEIPIPLATVMADHCLLRNFVGIKIGGADNCAHALIDLNSRQITDLNEIVKNNPYFLHCEKIFKDEWRSPKVPLGFGIGDLIMLLLIPAALFGVLLLLFHWEHSTFWRIFFLVPIFCWVGLGIEAIEENFDGYFPYVSRIQEYNKTFKQLRDKILKKENCKEFHVLG